MTSPTAQLQAELYAQAALSLSRQEGSWHVTTKYSLTARNYAMQRSELARAMGLRRNETGVGAR
ncbi:MucR family transcriptional regulator (plasmid) [Sinorhizobium meliloti]|nr:MucR family transcriptional regulator [Sinorhizobium medicae]